MPTGVGPTGAGPTGAGPTGAGPGNALRPDGAQPLVPAGIDVPPFYVMEMVKAAEERAAAGHEVLHLEVGQPSTGAPAIVLAAARDALAGRDPLGYTEAAGLGSLRRRIAAESGRRSGVEVDPDRVVVTAGSSAGFVLAFLAAFAPGARVGVTEPGYPCYRNTLTALGRVPVGIPVGPETGFRLTTEALDAAGPLDGVVVASPANPTGTVLGRADLAAIAAWCEQRGVPLISDEIYHGLTFGEPATSALAVAPEAVVVNSFSKYYSMTGWRIGWLVLPEPLLGPVVRLAQNLFICAPAIAQHAAVAAFDATAELEAHRTRYRHNRDVLLAAIRDAGLPEPAPSDGAFYVYVDVRRLLERAAVSRRRRSVSGDGASLDSRALCREWLTTIGVAATPGIDFDPVRGFGTVRFSVAGDSASVEEAARRLRLALSSRR